MFIKSQNFSKPHMIFFHCHIAIATAGRINKKSRDKEETKSRIENKEK
jgi:hypothetical protein